MNKKETDWSDLLAADALRTNIDDDHFASDSMSFLGGAQTLRELATIPSIVPYDMEVPKVENLFDEHPEIACILIDKDGTIEHCLSRFQFARRLARGFVPQIFSRKTVGEFCDFFSIGMFRMPAYLHVRKAAESALQRAETERWEPIVVNLDNNLPGIIEIDQLLVAVAQRLQAESNQRTRTALAIRSIFTASIDPIVAVNQQGIIEFCSDSVGQVFGYSPQELEGVRFDTLMSKPECTIQQGRLDQFLETGDWKTLPVPQEYTARRRDGAVFPCEVSISYVNSPGGESPLLVYIVHDITTRKEAEKQLKEHAIELERRVRDRTQELEKSEHKFRAMFESSHDATTLLVDGRFVDCNQATLELFGSPSVEHFCSFEPSDLSPAIQPGGEDSSELAKKYLKESSEQGSNFFEWTHRRLDGSIFTAEVLLSAMTFEGKPALLGRIRNISRRKQNEKALMEAKEQAEIASVAKSQFLASMSHELRTPLNGVIGMTELLKNTNLDMHQKQLVKACNTSGHSLLTLINDILDFSKIEAGRLELDEHEFELDQFIEETVVTMSYSARKKGLEIFNHFSPKVCGIARGDSSRLRQILVNLIGNAVKFTMEGEIHIRTYSVVDEDHNKIIRIEVSDTGIGIPLNRVHNLFESFTQADASTTRKFGGTGLGLAICKNLVELMNGHIGVESEVGSGSTFWLEIPLRLTRTSSPPTAALPSSLRYGRALILTDPKVRSHLSEILGNWKIATHWAAMPEEIVSMLRGASDSDHGFDFLVIDDQAVPISEIQAFTRAIDADPKMSSTKIVLVCNPENTPSTEEETKLGIDCYITKPIRHSALLDAINNCISTEGVDKRGSESVKEDSIPRPVNGTRVLLAEDNHVNQMYASEVLRQAGIESTVVINGNEAIDAIASDDFDLVLMDCQMPGMDGFEATRRIREMEISGELAGHIPIIALTANAVQGDQQRCLDAGMDDYVSKPFEPHNLMAKIEQLLSTEAGTTEESTSVSSPELGTNESKEEDDSLPIDREALLARCMGNLDFADSLLADFEEDLPDKVDQIAQYVEHGEIEAMTDTAHSLKGAAGIVVAESLREVVTEIEMAGKAADLSDTESLAEQLQSEAERCLHFIPKLREEIAAGSDS